jgi:hypothetical protein
MQRRMLAAAALAAIAAVGPVAAAHGAASTSKVMQGVVFGGVTQVSGAGATESSYPVVIRLNKTGTRMMRATIGIDLKCAMPPDITIPDDVATKDGVPIKGGKFVAVQPVTRIPADAASGTPAFDVSARVSGRVNRAHTQIKGSWSRTIVIYDPTDASATKVLDTCATTLRYTADN